MSDRDLLLQRLIDGRLSPAEAAALERTAQDDAAFAERYRLLQTLHQDLAAAASPLDGDAHHRLLDRIVQHLPAAKPQVYARVSPFDLVLAVSVLGCVAVAIGAVGSLVRGGVALLAAACISVTVGMLMLALAGMLRRVEAGVLRRLIGRPVTVGPADVLVYRAVGVGLALGGLYLLL
jgi:hypothetical protein